MTIVEFFDKTAIENIAGTLLCKPQKVIFVGDKRKQMEKGISVYSEVIRKRGLDTELSYKSVTKNNLQDILKALEEIVDGCRECVFDLTGGDTLYFAAVGMIMQKYPEKVTLRRFNFRNGTEIDYSKDSTNSVYKPLTLSVEENITIYGGHIITENAGGAYTFPWDFNDDFLNDVSLLWEICRKNVGFWNAQTTLLGLVSKEQGADDKLDININDALLKRAAERLSLRPEISVGLLRELQKCHLVTVAECADNMTLTFKNMQIKRCLTLAGQVLELSVAKRLKEAENKKGKIYDEVTVGVVIDWDREDSDDESRTVNEIDVIAIKGTVPIFVSCKNGFFDVDELYKLSIVADRFGNDYAVKVLVATEIEKLGSRSEFIRARAEDMGIKIIENADEMTAEEFDKAIRAII